MSDVWNSLQGLPARPGRDARSHRTARARRPARAAGDGTRLPAVLHQRVALFRLGSRPSQAAEVVRSVSRCSTTDWRDTSMCGPCYLFTAVVIAISVVPSGRGQPTVADLIDSGTVKEEQFAGILKAEEDESMMGAVRKDDPAMVARVLARSADPRADIELTGGDMKTLLMFAAIWGKGKEAVVPKLIEIGVPLNAVDETGHTATMYAASLNRLGVLRALLVR